MYICINIRDNFNSWIKEFIIIEKSKNSTSKLLHTVSNYESHNKKSVNINIKNFISHNDIKFLVDYHERENYNPDQITITIRKWGVIYILRESIKGSDIFDCIENSSIEFKRIDDVLLKTYYINYMRDINIDQNIFIYLTNINGQPIL